MINKKRIEKEIRELLNKFSKKLEKVNGLEEESIILRKNCLRVEGKGECDKNLNAKILKNAKSKNKEFIVAKEKSW